MYKNSAFYFVGLFGIAIIGFWQSYFSKFFDTLKFNAIDGYIHFHAATMVLWMLLLISQPLLIRFKKHSLHRLLGKSSFILVPLVIISLILLAHSQIVLGDYGVSYNRLYILFLQLSLLVIFVIAYSLAMINRKNPARHARYMIATSLTLIDPAVARLPIDLPSIPFSYQVYTFSLIDLILVILIIAEYRQQRGRDVFPIMLVIFVFFQSLNLTWTRSDLWDSFALWFAMLPLT
ncbi:hypothetical protein MNBD_GAMMA22-2094 [hydrothermal vent metagenome]|uniref:Uncharacterized protein n=1 Tax=hydrothermal vent metagenome TaxID=652676 RepID=A0A3B1AP17_9ZZZZ